MPASLMSLYWKPENFSSTIRSPYAPEFAHLRVYAGTVRGKCRV
jgi:hypothetical protein